MMTFQERLTPRHTMVSIMWFAVVPLLIYLVNGVVEPWMFLLGIGASVNYWVFKFPIL